ncbi:MAG: ComF family protein [Tannerella sp.]|jgi:ComF family protein|nr:ComF family protein [Tannerella sp.]
MWTIWNDLLQLFYPRQCLLCENLLIEGEKQICLYCLCDLPHTNYHKRPDNPMAGLYAGIPQIGETTAFLFFEKEGYTQTLIHALKYYGNKQLAEQLGRSASLKMKPDGFFHDIDCLIPVPLHPKKERRRGYNQSEWIARGIASVYQWPVNREILCRNIHTATQTRKSRYERHLNVEKIFTVKDSRALAGKHVLLIDDVVTTGATTIACIETLAKVPDIRISVFALAIVPILTETGNDSTIQRYPVHSDLHSECAAYKDL